MFVHAQTINIEKNKENVADKYLCVNSRKVAEQPAGPGNIPVGCFPQGQPL